MKARPLIPSIEENTVLLGGSEVVTQGSGFLVSLLVARLLGVESYGLLSFAYSLSLLCLILPGFGFGPLIVRETARYPSRAQSILTVVSLATWFFAAPMVLVAALASFFGGEGEGRVLVVIVVFLFLSTQQHMLFVCTFFRVFRQVRKEALLRTLLALLWLVTGAVVLFGGFGLKTLVISRLLVAALCLFLALRLLQHNPGVRFGPVRWDYGKNLIRMSVPLALLQAITLASGSLNGALLGLMSGNRATGYYYAADKIVTLFFVVPISLSWAVFPILSTQWIADRTAFRQTCDKVYRYLIMVAAPLLAGVFLLSDRIVPFLFGPSFGPSVPVMDILALTIPFYFLSHMGNMALVAMDRHSTAVRTSGTGLLLACVLSLALIPPFGTTGAAWGRVAACAGTALWETVLVARAIGCPRVLPAVLLSIIATAVMAGILVSVRVFDLTLVLLVPLSAAVYALVFLAAWRLSGQGDKE